METWVWQHHKWPHWYYNSSSLTELLTSVKSERGRLYSRLSTLGVNTRIGIELDTAVSEVIKSSAIEGIRVKRRDVRSSIARKLGIPIGGKIPAGSSNRYIDGIVEMSLDATLHFDLPLTMQRLYGWHAALFPSGYSGLREIRVGGFRNDELGRMEVVSGRMYNYTVHYVAPPASVLGIEMAKFIEWFNTNNADDPLIQAGISHLWFVMLHPFDDGNGRIARALTDMKLAIADGHSARSFSFSGQALKDIDNYYGILDISSKNDLDATPWLTWFLKSLQNAIKTSHETLDAVIFRHSFWNIAKDMNLNDRQNLILARMLDNFNGVMDLRKWSVITKCDSETALKDITDLAHKGILECVNLRKHKYEINKSFVDTCNITLDPAATQIQIEKQYNLQS